MSVLQVLHIPDERLRKVAKPVEEVNAEIQRIVDDMFETMYAEEGIGLAATQVDIHQRIIVIDVSENRDERLVLINPELLEKSGETGRTVDVTIRRIRKHFESTPDTPEIIATIHGEGYRFCGDLED